MTSNAEYARRYAAELNTADAAKVFALLAIGDAIREAGVLASFAERDKAGGDSSGGAPGRAR